MQEATSENVIAGNAMSRRSLYQFGALLAPGEKGQVDAGLGKTSSRGTVTLIAPTQLVTQPIETHRIDGLSLPTSPPFLEAIQPSRHPGLELL